MKAIKIIVATVVVSVFGYGLYSIYKIYNEPVLTAKEKDRQAILDALDVRTQPIDEEERTKILKELENQSQMPRAISEERQQILNVLNSN